MSNTHGIGCAYGLEQRSREQELIGKNIVGDVRPVVVVAALALDPQELLLVVPLVERLGLIEALVTLQTNQTRSENLRNAFCQLRLAGAGGTFYQNRFLQSVGEVDDTGDALV